MYYIRMYLDFVKGFSSIEEFAQYCDMPVWEAKRIVACGKDMHLDAMRRG